MLLTPDLEHLLDTMPYAVFVKDSEHRWLFGNVAFRKLIGCDDILGKDDRHLFSEDQVEVFWREDARVLAGEESLNEEQIGEDQFAITKKVPIKLPDGSTGLLGIIIDYINTNPKRRAQIVAPAYGGLQPEMTALQRRLETALTEKAEAVQVAQTDAATGLRNRHGLEADLERQIAEARDTGRSFGLALVDLDHFKRINDRFGHAVGDAVLKVVGGRLAALPGVVSVGRIGGDEFAIVTEEINALEETLKSRFERLRKIVFRPAGIGEREIKISGSAGLCMYPRDGGTASELLSRADLALFSAKRTGRSASQVFDEVTLGAYMRRVQIEEKLADAIQDEKVVPVFQPIVCSHSRRVLGVEVLARWHDPVLGHISPDEFVPAATDIGLIGHLDRAVFKQAAVHAKTWLDNGDIEFFSLNASPTDVVSPGYATDFLRRIAQTGIAPGSICLEILESSLVEDVSSARRNLQRLREAGVQIALDDYGTGFSNLRALLDMPLDKLKIDKSLVSGIETNDRLLDLVISLVQLGRALDLVMVAEGIETDSQSAFIEGTGCSQMQGYLFSKPLSSAAMSDWLSARRVGAEAQSADAAASAQLG